MGACDHAPAVAVAHLQTFNAPPDSVAAAVQKNPHAHAWKPATDFAAYQKDGGYALLKACLTGKRTPDDLTSNPDHNVSHNYSVGVGFTSYELDLFGRVRSLKHQALETYLAYEENRRSAQLSLVAEVANAYLSWLADQELLQMTQDTFDSR